MGDYTGGRCDDYMCSGGCATRGRLIDSAIDAGDAAGWPGWWPELAPLTREEREFVQETGTRKAVNRE